MPLEAIFDGRSLAGWERDPKYWRVEDGVIIGEVAPETLLKQYSFLIWRGGAPADFELKVSYRISVRGNSGINYRSVEVPDVPFALRGYPADIDGGNPDRPGIPHTANLVEAAVDWSHRAATTATRDLENTRVRG